MPWRSGSFLKRARYCGLPAAVPWRSGSFLKRARSCGLPGPALRRLLLASLLAQLAVLLAYFFPFFSEMFRAASTLQAPAPATWGTFALLAALAFSARLWSGPDGERFAAAALAHAAALVLFHYALGLAAGRLFPEATAVFLALSISGGAVLALRRGRPALPDCPVQLCWTVPSLNLQEWDVLEFTGMGRPAPAAQPGAPFTAWDGLSVFILLTLLIPAFFPYIHYDVKHFWACRAFALGQSPSFSAMASCVYPQYPAAGPTYPPAWSILLWLGIKDPVFQGRLLAWALLPLFAVFFRARLARIDARLAAPALLFMLATVCVWDGAATYYADVPLMIFLTAGTLLVLGLPGQAGAAREKGAPISDLAAGTLCLSAAVLMRPDGYYYLGVALIAVLWFRFWRHGAQAVSLSAPGAGPYRARRRARFPIWPFAAALLVFASWQLLRPADLNAASQYLHPNALWHQAGKTTGQALWNLLLVFLNGTQGKWLSNRRAGVTFYLLAGLWLWSRRRGAKPAGEDRAFFGLTSLGAIGAVLLCFALIPFAGDPTSSCAPGTPYLATYMAFIRTSMDRVTAHLFPFFVLWGTAVLDSESSKT